MCACSAQAQNMLTGVLDDAKEKIAVMDAAERGKREPCSLRYLATVDRFGSIRGFAFRSSYSCLARLSQLQRRSTPKNW
jgi:hypothetical protein